MKITFKTLGFKAEIEAKAGSTFSEAVEVFERITGKAIQKMDLFSGGSKVTNLDAEVEDGAEITAVASKHESAATIKFKTLGFSAEVECEDGASCTEAIEVFERMTGKAIQKMDLFADGKKITDLNTEAPQEITAVASKHESA